MQQRVDPATLFASVVKLLPEALIDSLAPASIFPPRGVGWGALRHLAPAGGVQKGHGEGCWLYPGMGLCGSRPELAGQTVRGGGKSEPGPSPGVMGQLRWGVGVGI